MTVINATISDQDELMELKRPHVPLANRFSSAIASAAGVDIIVADERGKVIRDPRIMTRDVIPMR